MKKAILLAMAVVVAMLAMSSSASAAWTKHHSAISSDVEVEVTGTEFGYEDELGAFECDTISNVVFEAANGGTTGTIKTFEPHGEATNLSVCRGTGVRNHCEVHKFTPHGLPWTIHTTGADTISITTGLITTDHTGFLCGDPITAPGTLQLTVPAGQTATTSTATLNGTLSEPNSEPIFNMVGIFHVLGPITYGI